MKIILPSLLFSLFVLMVAGSVWSSKEFEEMPDKHLERINNMMQASFL